MNKRKVCLVIPTLQAGGMERVMSELAGYFCRKSELEVHLVLYGKNPEIFYQLPENIILHKPLFSFNDKHRLWFTIKTLLFLRKKIRNINPHTTLSFGEYWNSFVLISLLGLHYPVFVADRSSPVKNLGKIHNFLRLVLYKKAEGIIVQTKKAKKIYEKRFRETKLFVIGNPIREIKRDGKETVTKENIVLSVGRLIDTKHHDQLIESFIKVRQKGWKLVIVGDNAKKQNNRQKLENLIKKLNAEKYIFLAGKQKDVDSYYLKSKIFAFMSSSEGFPNVIGEAMSAGLPVLAYDCVAGPSELIEHEKTGYLVPLFDNITFERYLQLLMQNEDLRNTLGKNGKQKIKNFSIDIIGDKFYNNIILSKPQ